VLPAWRAWLAQIPATALTAVRLGERIVAVDVALVGDPWGAGPRLALLRQLRPGADTVGLVAPAALLGRRGGAPAPLATATATAPLPALPDPAALAAAPIPDGICLGLRRDGALLALGIEADAPRLRAAVAGLERAIQVTTLTS
jgi:hypothetical protein